VGSVNKSNFGFWKFILDLISFNSPLAIVINLTLILLIFSFVPTSNLRYLPIRSLYGDFIIPLFFNNSCLAHGFFTNCGFYSVGQTRAISNFLRGDFVSAYRSNKLIFILFLALLAVLIINIIKIYKKYKKTGRIN
jgi:hypothetical protein